MAGKYALLALLLGLVVVIAISYVISPFNAGKPLAEKAQIPYPALIAHRGASYLAPEETAPAYFLAAEMGADYLEMDLHLTKDGVLVAIHDDDLVRTTNIAEVFPKRQKDQINTFTFKELQMLDAGSWFNAKYPERARDIYKNLKILDLSAIITLAEQGKNKPGLYIESKSPEKYPGIEKKIVELLTQRKWLPASPKGKVIFQSFSLKSLQVFQELAPDVPRIYLVDQDEEKKVGGWEALESAASQVAIGLGPEILQSTPWNVGSAHKKGLLVHTYTSNLLWQLLLLRGCGVDGFFTNRCELAIKYFKPGSHIDLPALFAEYSKKHS